MSPWLLIVLTFNLFASTCNAEGPTSETEATILWHDGKTAFETKKYEDATVALQRYVDRYPGHQGYLDAQYFLGVSYLSIKQPKKALKPLKYYVEALGNTSGSMRGRIPLGETYLQLGKFNEAYLTSLELIDFKTHSTDQLNQKDPAQNLRALLLKTQALIGMNRDVRANQALDAFRQEFKKDPDAEGSDLKAPYKSSEFTLKTRSCLRLPSPGKMDEAQARAQLNRKGDCMLEAGTLFVDLIRTGDESWAKPGALTFEKMAHSYLNNCAHPPVPTGKRTPKELASYAQELSAVLKKDCRLKMDRALEILHIDTLPNSMLSLLQSTSAELKKESEAL